MSQGWNLNMNFTIGHTIKIFNQFFGIENKENKIPEFKLKIAVYLLT